MTVNVLVTTWPVLTLLACAAPLKAELSAEQAYALLARANEAFRQANALAGDPKAGTLYEQAILTYEKIIEQGRIHNAKLYYNLANAYLLKEDLGKAILNYRRAERLDDSDANIKKNLEFARTQCLDRITPKTRKRVLQTLFFWHYDFSTRTRFVLACLSFAALCIAGTVMVWLGRSAPLTAVCIIASVLTLCLLVSLVLEVRRSSALVEGVITADEIVARQGDGRNYPASFKDPLHEGTEFTLLETRPGWFHIVLADGSDAWIPQDAAELI